MASLLDPIDLGARRARNRVLFGPIVTNLGNDDRTFSGRHLAFYRRRAVGGCGTIVLEEASVHPGDWPTERGPLAERCGDSWAMLATRLRGDGAVVLAGLGHSGGQGTSAWSQRELWAPSRVPEVAAREVPKWMEPEDIAAIVDGFRAAAKIAGQSGLDGVEINAGQHSLIRQFLSGLTNHRGDEWGTDRLRFAREVLGAARDGLGAGKVLALRLSCDELAPWAGITPEMANDIARELAPMVDLITVVRGSIFSIQATRPDFHDAPGFNIELCRSVRAAVDGAVPVALQGSIVDVGQAEWAMSDGVCDLVEMTRAQLADAELVAKVSSGVREQVRPCILCNQTCQVRDARNPIISCVADPTTGHEDHEPLPGGRTSPSRSRRVAVVGGGPAGLECARVASSRGHAVTVYERADALGGVARYAGPGRSLVDWLAAECARLGVDVRVGHDVRELSDLNAAHDIVVVCTGGRSGVRTYDIADGAIVLDAASPSLFDEIGDGTVAIWDPIGGPIAVAIAERLGSRASLITPDQIAGNELSRTGDLAPANSRLQQQGVRIERRAVLKVVRAGEVEIEDRFTAVRRTVSCDVLVDAGFRLPDDALWVAGGRQHHRAGDLVAPRTISEAVLEGRRVAMSLDG